MARSTRPLTNTKFYERTLHDGEVLFLIVKPTGKKLCRFRYQRPSTKKRTFKERYDSDVYPTLIFKITDAVIEWQNQPLDARYPIV